MFRSSALLLLAVPFALFADNASADTDCEFHADRSVTLNAAGLERFALEARAGDLQVRGEAGLKRIEVRGRACASDAESLAKIRFAERRDGSQAVVKVEMPEPHDGWFDEHYAYMDVEVRVPQTMIVGISDSSGDMNLRGVNVATIHDSSGDIEVEDARGALRVTDSSGDIDVRVASGSVTIDVDSSGEIDIEQVAGDVTVATDSSGSIELSRIDGHARVERDSSGDITFKGIARDAFVGTDSSGSIVADDVGGDFTVRRDGSGGVDHSGVRGRVDVPEED